MAQSPDTDEKVYGWSVVLARPLLKGSGRLLLLAYTPGLGGDPPFIPEDPRNRWTVCVYDPGSTGVRDSWETTSCASALDDWHSRLPDTGRRP
jgi:hypothetical protein